MKLQPFFISLLMLAGVGCAPTPQAENHQTLNRDQYLKSLDPSELNDGLVFWTSDTAYNTNPDLLLLLDTLYRHVRTDSFPSEVRIEEQWMKDYRSRLCAYYDTHSLGSETISIYAKADSVLNEGVRLMELDCQWSTMEMIVNNSTEYTFDRCREYGQLTQLINCCETEEKKDLVYEEWAIYEKMRKKIMNISSNIVQLNYWHGSLAGPWATANYLTISGSRQYMYETVLNLVKGNGWDGTGVYFKSAERLLFDCCAESLNRIENTIQNDAFGEDATEMRQMVKETEEDIQELRLLIEEWINLMDKFDYALTCDGSRRDLERAGSFMLMKWASIVSM